ncbi:MAG TPA: prepilin-type N-terminal cleavage/methylation domain-containing protein [Gemmatimonadaceae bacterium]|nr:prepilin-type N-terminal cleavage/methylation domain-containing protein [Gemmatimonadaceae bacterium]
MRISTRKSHRTALQSGRTNGGRQGFVLVEVIVAMVLLAVAVSSLAALVYSVSHSGIRTSGDAYKNGVLMQEVNRLEGIPYDSIPVQNATVRFTTPQYTYDRTVQVTEVQANVIKSIKVVIKPTNPQFKADSVDFIRTKSRTSRVLCTDCPQG